MFETSLSIISLVFMEITMGIDNLVFVAIITSALKGKQRITAQRIGMSLAVIIRILALTMISYVIHLSTPLFTLINHSFSWKDIIMLFGGSFLLLKAVWEIYHKVEHIKEKEISGNGLSARFQLMMRKYISPFVSAIISIVLLDIVFSIDSIITAIGMTDTLWIMIVAVIIAILVMIIAVERIAPIIDSRPALKLLALSFLVMIGSFLLLQSIGNEIEHNVLYITMGFMTAFYFMIERYEYNAKKHTSLEQ